MLKINNLYAGYKKNDYILRNINLEINTGEILLVIGKNGAGKSTLAKAVINTLPYIEGEILFEDELLFSSDKNVNMSSYEIVNRGIGYFLQGGRVFPNLTVEENLLLAAPKKDFKYSGFFLKFKAEFGFIDEMLKEKATYLSLGQKHSLALAMVLIKNPKFLILDEPTAGLDDKNVEIVVDIISNLKKENDLSILLIEHKTEEIRELADRRVEVENGKLL